MSYEASDLANIAGKLNAIMYSFLYFCPPPGTSPMPYWAQPPYGSCTDATAFQIMSVEPRDASFFASIKGFQEQNPSLKSFILSIGGWNFPSSYFSALAASPTARATFAASAKQWLATSGANGLELDWESPCSVAREDDVEISCTDFDRVADSGGKCPEDTANIVSLYEDLRSALPGVTLSLAAQASKKLEEKEGIAKLFAHLDRFNVMTYDYAVSDVSQLPPGSGMSPNAPLLMPKSAGALNYSIVSTVAAYLMLGVPPEKIHVGIPLYGHSWFNASLAAGGAWKQFGAVPAVLGLCCGPFATTFGGRPGPAALQCGTLMYSEIVAAAADLTVFDRETFSNIAYFSKPGADGTPAGTWVSYNDVESVREIAAWARKKGLGGVFVFDSSMDTFSGGEWTYTLMNAIAAELAG